MKILKAILNLVLIVWLAVLSIYFVAAQSDNENRFRVIADRLYLDMVGHELKEVEE